MSLENPFNRPLATEAEAEAGLTDLKAMSPLKTAAAIAGLTGDDSAAAVAVSLGNHEAATGTAVHGLGSASTSAVGDFDAAGSAAAAEVSAKTNDLQTIRMNAAASAMADSVAHAGESIARYQTIQYIDAATRYIWSPVNGIHWARIEMALLSSGVWRTSEMRIYQVLDGVNDDDAGITYGGGSWINQPPITPSAMGDSRTYGYIAGQYTEFDITGADALWIVYQGNTIGGYVKAEIDGTQDLTKQYMNELVDGDYVFSTYLPVNLGLQVQKVAGELNPQKTYTVRLTIVATIPTGSTGNRLYFEGYAAAPTRFDAAGVQNINNTQLRLENITSDDNGWAINYTAAGASSAETLGNSHLSETVVSSTFTDGNGISIEVDAAVTMKTAKSIVLIEDTTLQHPETGATNHASIKKSVTFSQGGIHQSLRINWLTSSVVNYAYWGQIGVWLTRLQLAGFAEQYELTVNDGERYGQLKSTGAMMWDTAHNFAILYQFADQSTVNNLEVNGLIEYLDSLGYDGGKLYPKLINDAIAVENGDVWLAAWRWRILEIANLENIL